MDSRLCRSYNIILRTFGTSQNSFTFFYIFCEANFFTVSGNFFSRTVFFTFCSRSCQVLPMICQYHFPSFSNETLFSLFSFRFVSFCFVCWKKRVFLIWMESFVNRGMRDRTISIWTKISVKKLLLLLLMFQKQRCFFITLSWRFSRWWHLIKWLSLLLLLTILCWTSFEDENLIPGFSFSACSIIRRRLITMRGLSGQSSQFL